MRKRFARILCGSLSVMLFCGQGMAYAGTVPAENETGKGRFFMLPSAKNTESKAEYGCIGVNLVIPQDIDLQQDSQTIQFHFAVHFQNPVLLSLPVLHSMIPEIPAAGRYPVE